MKPSQLAIFLAASINARRPVLITGMPGVGKSDIVEQATQAADAEFLLSHPVTADPTDAKGLPWPNKDHTAATFLPFGDLERARNAKKKTVWFLDDLGQAQPAVQASFMQLILARCVNGHKISEHVTFIAATNRRIDRAGVSGILEPVKSRFVSIVELKPDMDDWSTWAFAHNIAPELIAFLRFRPELLCAFEPTADMTNSPIPRTWANAAGVLEMQLPAAIELEGLAGAVGDKGATELQGFLQMYRQLPSIDAILADPDGQDIPSNPSVLYAVASGLVYKTNVQNFGHVARYTERLVEEAHGEMGTFLMRSVTRQVPEVQNTPEFVRLMSGDLGKLISGTFDE